MPVTELAGSQPRRVSYPLPLSRPIATWVLLGLILAAFAVEQLAGGSTQTDVLVRLGAKVTPLIAGGQYWRLLTSMFLHIGLAHLVFNGYALVAVGTDLERILGWRKFLVIYLLCGLLGSLVSYALSPNLAAGASGAIFGVIGALAAFFALHRERLGAWGRSRLANIAFLITINLFFGFTQKGIDNYAHLGGLLSGLALGWALAPRYAVDPVALRVVDRNHLGRYWPALLLAVASLVGGTALATVLQRDSAQGHLWRAQAAIDREAWDEAVPDLEQALAGDLAPTAASQAYFYLGLARNRLGQGPLAADAYESSLDLQPNEPAAHWNLALTYLGLERHADAKAQFEAYLKLEPDKASKVQPYLDQLRTLPP